MSRRTQEDKQFEIAFKEEHSRYLTRLDHYNENLVKVYALIWERCATGMRNKISNGKDFRSRVYDNPIELLREIKKHALNYQEYKYEMTIVADSLRTLLHMRQKDQENLQDYARRFKTAEEIFKSHIGGPLIIPSIVRSDHDFNEEGDVDVNKQVMEDVYERFLVHIFLEQSDSD